MIKHIDFYTNTSRTGIKNNSTVVNLFIIGSYKVWMTSYCFRQSHLLLHTEDRRAEVVAGPDTNQQHWQGPGDHQPTLSGDHRQCLPHRAPGRGKGSVQALLPTVRQLQHLPGVLLRTGAGGVRLHQGWQADWGTSHHLWSGCHSSQRFEPVK